MAPSAPRAISRSCVLPPAALPRERFCPLPRHAAASLSKGPISARTAERGSPDADGRSRLVNARAAPQESLDRPFRLSVDPRSPNRFAALGALRSGLAHARNHALGKPLGLLLGHGGEHR